MQITVSGKEYGMYQVVFDKSGIALFKDGKRVWLK